MIEILEQIGNVILHLVTLFFMAMAIWYLIMSVKERFK